MANGHGGARPGAGRKNEETRATQLANRQVMLEEVTDEDLRIVARAMVERAKAGDDKAFRAFMAYVLGSPESELTVKGDASAPLTIEVVYVDQEPEDG